MLSASASFAASDDDIAVGEVTDEIAIDETVLAVEEDSNLDDVSSVADENILSEDSPDNIVTNETFHNYFDESGTLLDTVTADELVFEGNFSGIDVNYITVLTPIKLTGNNAFFDNVDFIIGADDVTVDGFTLTRTSNQLFYIEGVSNVVISNNKIDFNAVQDDDAYAIYASVVDNLKIINNTITYVGTTKGTHFNNVIRVVGDGEEETPSEDILIDNNNITATMPSIRVGSTELGDRLPYSEAVAAYYCENINITRNKIDLKYNTTSGSADTIYGIAVRSILLDYDFDDDWNLIFNWVRSKNAIINDNEINAIGHTYIYGISVSSEGFEISNNKLNISSDKSYANGINVEGPAFDGVVSGNNLSIEAPDNVYAIYTWSTMGAVGEVNYTDNEIYGDSNAACGMEIRQSKAYIAGNVISLEGNYTYGICESMIEDSTIIDNTISSLGTNIGAQGSGDAILPSNSMGITVKANATISNNKITSTAIGINAVEDGIVIINNNVIDVNASETVDNYAIVIDSIERVAISENNITFVGRSNGPVATEELSSWGSPVMDYSETSKTYALYINDVSDAVIDSNNFDISIPSMAVNWVEEPPSSWNYVRYAYSEGLVFDGCDGLVLSDNVVDLVYNTVEFGTIYVVDIIGSDDVVVDGNNITAVGENYIYAVIVDGADNFTISDNVVDVTSGYYACGVDVEGPAAGVVKDNAISVVAFDSAYPVYSGMNGMSVSANFTGNDLYGEAYYVVGLELAGDSAVVEDNTVDVNGNYTMGIASIVSDLTVKGNNISAAASNVGSSYIGDSMGGVSAGIFIKSGSADIVDNGIAASSIGVNVAADNVDISGNVIGVVADGSVDNFAICADGVANLTVADNNVTFGGASNGPVATEELTSWGTPVMDYSETSKTYAVYLVDVSGAVVDGNIFNVSIPSMAVNWVEEPPSSWNYVRYAYSEGLVFDGCDGLVLSDNVVDLVYNTVEFGTIYVVDIIGSDDVVVDGNNITAVGENYIYAVIVDGADNFTISDNVVDVTSGYYACGVDVEGPAAGVVKDNAISVVAFDSAYPVYSGMNGMSVSANFTGNDLYGEAYYVVGLELAGDSAVVEDNTVDVNGNYTMGIASIVSDLTVKGNNITSNASNVGTSYIGDSMGGVSTGVLVKSGNAEIVDNSIVSTSDSAINLTDTSSNVSENDVVSKNGAGAKAISSTGNANIADNFAKTILSGSNVSMSYNDDNKYAVTLTYENGYGVANETIEFTINGVVQNVKTDANGVASISLSDLAAGNYVVVAVYSGDNETLKSSVNNTITVAQKATKLVYADSTLLLTAVKAGAYYQFTITDVDGKPLAGKQVTVTFNGASTSVAADANGVVSYELAATKEGTYQLTMSFAGDNNYAASSGVATIKLNKEATKVKVSKTKFKAKTKTKKVKVTLKDSKNKAIKGVKVTIKVKGKTYKAKTNKKGVATVKITKLNKKGTYKAKVRFAGNTYYKAVTKTVKIKVTK